MEVWMLRHGRTQGNLEHRYVGRTDEELTEQQKQELKKLAGVFPRPDLLYVSPMRRCRQTAEGLFPGQEQILWEAFRETDFGEYEYLTYEDLNGRPAYQAWIDSGGLTAFPYGESGEAFRRRCWQGFQSCMADASHRGAESVGIVCHGGTIMSICAALTGDPASFYHWQAANLQGFRMEITENGTNREICLEGSIQKLADTCKSKKNSVL